jgi:hypothetical protein
LVRTKAAGDGAGPGAQRRGNQRLDLASRPQRGAAWRAAALLAAAASVAVAGSSAADFTLGHLATIDLKARRGAGDEVRVDP